MEDAKDAALVGGRKPQRFIPFSQGNRDCVGQTLARLNLATTLAQLFGNFSFALAAEVGRAVHLCTLGLERGWRGPLSSCCTPEATPLAAAVRAHPCIHCNTPPSMPEGTARPANWLRRPHRLPCCIQSVQTF